MTLAVGGVGGGGTRLVAQMLCELGFFMGHDLNDACDNLLFTLLFKHPAVLDFCDKDFARLYAFFSSAMAEGGKVDLAWVAQLPHVLQPDSHGVAKWNLERLRRAGEMSAYEPHPRGWAWKEPNTHWVIDRLWRLDPELKYVHVRRNGLDMALSENQRQPALWGQSALGEQPPVPMTPNYSLRYWVTAERRIEQRVEDAGASDRFFLFDFDAVCNGDKRVLAQFLEFLGVVVHSNVDRLAAMVRRPDSIGRWRMANVFSGDEVALAESVMGSV